MAKKKTKKIQFETMEPLGHNPFASLGHKLSVSPKPDDSSHSHPIEEKNQTQPILMVRMEKRKKGKMVTCIYHLIQDQQDLLKTLKKKLGTGGTVVEGRLELQGDRREKLPDVLAEMGFKVRLGN